MAVLRDFLTLTKALSDETRVRAFLTARDGELCLCQIIEVLGLAPSTVSKHMNLLQQGGLVERHKQGKWHYYRLADAGAATPAARALAFTLEALEQSRAVRQDRRNAHHARRQDPAQLSACYR